MNQIVFGADPPPRRNKLIRRDVSIKLTRLDLGHKKVNRMNTKTPLKRIQTTSIRGPRGLRTPTHVQETQRANKTTQK
jgi:hypothetical protein